MCGPIFGSLLPSMLTAWTAAWIVRRYGMRWGLVDRPGPRKIHAAAMPTGGGLAIWLAVVVPFALGQAVLAGFPWPIIFPLPLPVSPRFACRHSSRPICRAFGSNRTSFGCSFRAGPC